LNQITRYVINGVIATGIHYGVLIFNLEVLNFPSAGLANLIAAVFGITSSFVGSRYFVFCKTDDSILAQAVKFSGLYGAIAVLHGFVLLLWTDWFGLAYGIGFIIATFLQVSLSYIGNRRLVFSA
jgi:putative flippase GtrA